MVMFLIFLSYLTRVIVADFFNPPILVNHFKTDPATGLPDLTHFNDVDVK
jgi:hypothetical protein